MKSFKIGIFLALAANVVATSAVAQEKTSPSNVASGKRIFMSDGCYQCHGTTGAGGGAAGPKLSRTELPLEAFQLQLRMPAQRMPAYSEIVISDAQIADIYAYVQSIPQSPSADKIPLLNR